MSPLFMSILLVAGLGVFGWTARRRWKLMFAAAAPAALGDAGDRVGRVLRYALGQARMFRYSAAGIAHAFIFTGFVILGLRTLILFARGYTRHDFGFWLFDDGALLGRVYLLLKDLIGVFVIAGVVYFLHTRLVVKPRRMELSREGVFILCMILGIILSDMFYEAGLIAVGAGSGGGRFHFATPIASLLSLPLQLLPVQIPANLATLGFWLHAVIVLTFLNFLPYGKHFHVLTIIPQVFFSRPQPHGRLQPIADIEGKLERSETLGVKAARDFSWKSVLDFYTCTECGRCSDHCPAFNTGKLLSPKHLTMDLRDHMYRNEAALLSAPRGDASGGAAPVDAVAPPGGRPAAAWVRKDGAADESGGELVAGWVDPEMLWACTTCGACEQECPVFISYIDKIVDLRRNLVMEKGEFPQQLQNAFRGLETVQNPYSFDNSQRAEWAEGLNIPLKADKPDAEILYWVGCAPSYDDRSKKIARAMAQLMQHAGVDFAILGPEECCTGDPARRAGNEYLFEMLARQNVETLNNHGVKRVVTTCPHCFNTLKNEYGDFGGRYEVIHHTDFLAELLRAGRIRPQGRIEGTIAYHDACYIGRHNGIYDAPRDLLRAIPGLTLVDPPESRDRGMCCGAGGAQMWKEDEPVRRPGSREGDGKVNHARTRQLLRVLPAPAAAASGGAMVAAASGNAAPGGCRKIASACPFCKTMLSDGLKDQGHDDVEQADIAELLWKSVSGA